LSTGVLAIRILRRRVWELEQTVPAEAPQSIANCAIASACSNSFRRSEVIGLEQMDEDVYRVFFCSTELGEFNASEMRFRPAACP
jgi:hypothetical protein